MKISRRGFLKLSGVAGAAAGLTGWGFFPRYGAAVPAPAQEKLRIRHAQEVPTICPYCSVGCGAICYVEEGEVTAVGGDPDHPINEGSLCSKGSSLLNLRSIYDASTKERKLNPQRLTKVLYRAPYSGRWEVKSWDWALAEIARRVKQTRDATFVSKDENGVTVNRTTAMAHLGSAALDNEENYVLVKLQRSLGLINIDHHARL